MFNFSFLHSLLNYVFLDICYISKKEKKREMAEIKLEYAFIHIRSIHLWYWYIFRAVPWSKSRGLGEYFFINIFVTIFCNNCFVLISGGGGGGGGGAWYYWMFSLQCASTFSIFNVIGFLWNADLNIYFSHTLHPMLHNWYNKGNGMCMYHKRLPLIWGLRAAWLSELFVCGRLAD